MFSSELISGSNVIDLETITNFINSILSGYYIALNKDGIIGITKKEKIDIYLIKKVEKLEKSYKLICEKIDFDIYSKKHKTGEKIEIPIIINKKQVNNLFLQNLWNYMTIKNIKYIIKDGYNFLGIKTAEQMGFGDIPFFIVNKTSYENICDIFYAISSQDIKNYNENFQNDIKNLVDFNLSIDVETIFNIIYFIGKFGEENFQFANKLYNNFVNFFSTKNVFNSVFNLKNILSSSIVYAYSISIIGNMFYDLHNITKDISFNSLSRIFLLSKIKNVSGYHTLIEQSGYEFQ